MDRLTRHTVGDFCARQLGGTVARELFVVGARVYGLELGDGRRVVVKRHPRDRPVALVQEVVRVQMHLASRGLYAPTVVGGPLLLGDALATVEALVGGTRRDAHDPVAVRALAEAHARVVEACRPLAAASSLPRGPALPSGSSSHGDGSGGDGSDGEWVIVHADFSVEHVRFSGDTIVVAYGWGNVRRCFRRHTRPA